MIKNKKIRKLLHNPKMFFRDSLAKRMPKYGFSFSISKYSGNYNYTIISAVYNVEDYLDDYFKSITRQSMNFCKNITIVLVDDGSIDNSASIIKSWQSKYPDNIIYLYKENGGQASARNVGIDYVVNNNIQSDWTTFIDPDDFIDINYFYNIDSFLLKVGPVSMISTYNIQFFEKNSVKSDTHFLNYRFSGGNFVAPSYSLNGYPQCSASTCLFLTKEIIDRNVRFNQNIRPCFEDAHFVGVYLLALDGGMVAFIREAKYYARKRKNKTSTMDNAYKSKERYLNVPEYGLLNLLNAFHSKYEVVPDFIQKVVLSELYYMVKPFIDGSVNFRFLTDSEQSSLFNLCHNIMSFIDNDIIEMANLGAKVSWMYRVGLLGLKNAAPIEKRVHVTDYDPVKSQILVSYFSGSIGLEAFIINGIDVIPDYVKSRMHSFMDKDFVIERHIWLPIPKNHTDKVLEVFLDGVRATIIVGNTHVKNKKVKKYDRHFQMMDMNKHFYENSYLERKKDSLWLFMDRHSNADDSAEHLYRHIQKNHPEKRIGFLLETESADWNRLKMDGFNLIPFGSAYFFKALNSCDKLIASFDNKCVKEFFHPPSFNNRHFIWLDHGIIRNDTFSYHNGKPISLFITAAHSTYDFISSDMSHFRYTKKETCVTGLARHDNLLKDDVTKEKLILVCPTWRKHLENTDDFSGSLYAKAWERLLSNDRLIHMAKTHGYKITFLPHHMLGKYLNDFATSPEVDVRSYDDGPLQILFKKASLLITDYSSISMEFGYLQKPVIFYQFDKEEFFSSHHQEGYFLDSRDGFGPVVETEEEVLNLIDRLLTEGMTPDQLYLERMEKFFPYRDGKCCERIYQKISELDQPRPQGVLDISILQDYARMASKAGNIFLAHSRWMLLLQALEDSVLSSGDDLPEDIARDMEEAKQALECLK